MEGCRQGKPLSFEETAHETNSWWSRVRQLRELLDEVVEVRWGHPAWWTLVLGAAALEGWAPAAGLAQEAEELFLSANGWPHSDTFMARESPTESRALTMESLPWAVARAAVRGRLAVEALARREGTLPGQPLRQCLAWRQGWLEPRLLSGQDGDAVAFVTPAGVFRARLTEETEAAVARALQRVLLSPSAADLPGKGPLEVVDSTSQQPLAAAVAVAVGRWPLPAARHLHRRSWTAGGGPWLGLVEADSLELTTTCHRAVDGYGHGVLTGEIFAAMDRARERIAELAHRLRGDLDAKDLAGQSLLEDRETAGREEPLGFAGRRLDGPPGRFAEQAYAFGHALHRFWPESAAGGTRFSPSFQVPVAPGVVGDPQRRRRRITSALLSLRRNGEGYESLEAFRERLPAWLERERGGRGLLHRLTAAVAASCLAASARRRLLVARRDPSSWLPAVAALGGRGRLSSIRFAPEDRPRGPLYAASMPPLGGGHGGGSLTLTLMHLDTGCCAAVYGSGAAGTAAGAGAFLDLWLEELERLAPA